MHLPPPRLARPGPHAPPGAFARGDRTRTARRERNTSARARRRPARRCGEGARARVCAGCTRTWQVARARPGRSGALCPHASPPPRSSSPRQHLSFLFFRTIYVCARSRTVTSNELKLPLRRRQWGARADAQGAPRDGGRGAPDPGAQSGDPAARQPAAHHQRRGGRRRRRAGYCRQPRGAGPDAPPQPAEAAQGAR